MTCDSPSCTGVHDTARPESILCPRAIEAKRERNRQWMSRYNDTAAGMLAHLRHNAKRRGTR